MRNSGIIYFLFFSAVILIDRAYAQDAPYKTLKGKVERKEYHTYIEHPFILPDGVKRLRVEFSYTGKVFALLVAARNNESDPAECQCRKGAGYLFSHIGKRLSCRPGDMEGDKPEKDHRTQESGNYLYPDPKNDRSAGTY